MTQTSNNRGTIVGSVALLVALVAAAGLVYLYLQTRDGDPDPDPDPDHEWSTDG